MLIHTRIASIGFEHDGVSIDVGAFDTDVVRMIGSLSPEKFDSEKQLSAWSVAWMEYAMQYSCIAFFSAMEEVAPTHSAINKIVDALESGKRLIQMTEVGVIVCSQYEEGLAEVAEAAIIAAGGHTYKRVKDINDVVELCVGEQMGPIE